MKLDEPIETSGFFWLPEEPDVRVPGDLHISESGEARLEVQLQEISPGWSKVINTGMSVDGREVARILGISSRQGAITLDECPVTRMRNFVVPPTELTLSPRLTLTGCHYEAEEEVTFTEFSFSTEGIDEWLGVSGIDVQFDKDAIKTVIEARVPEEIFIDLPDEVVMAFKFGMSLPTMTRTITDARITQKTFVSLVSDQPRPLDYFTSMATKIRNFLRLAIGQPVSIESVTGYTPELTRDDGAGGERKVPIQVYYRQSGNSDKKQEVRWHQIRFFYTEIEGQIGDILTNWLQSYQILGPVLDLYFTAMSNTSQYLEVEFLQRIQGIETMHRRSDPETEMPEHEFREFMDSVLSACPDSRQEWLKGRLRYANEPSLRRRLTEMIKPFERFFGDARQQKAFVAKVVVTRNYLTHYDSKLEGQAANGADLWKLTAGLEALFQLHLLQLVGFDPGRIDRVLRGHNNLPRLLTSAGMPVREVNGQRDNTG